MIFAACRREIRISQQFLPRSTAVLSEFSIGSKTITGQYDTREGVSSAIYIHVLYAHMLKFLRYKWYRSHVSLQNRAHLSYDKVCMARGTDPDEDAMCGV